MFIAVFFGGAPGGYPGPVGAAGGYPGCPVGAAGGYPGPVGPIIIKN